MKGDCKHWNREIYRAKGELLSIALDEYDDDDDGRSILITGNSDDAISVRIEEVPRFILMLQEVLKHAEDPSECSHRTESGICRWAK